MAGEVTMGAAKRRRLLLDIVILSVMLAVCVAAFFYFRSAFFLDNPRFLIKPENLRIAVQSDAKLSQILSNRASGDEKEAIWKAIVWSSLTEAERCSPRIQRILQNTPAVNLFRLNLGELSDKMTIDIPSIRSSEISMELPDRILVKIHVRAPSAAIDRSDGLYVCDHEGMIMKREATEAASNPLPVITGLRAKNLRVNTRLDDLQPALSLLYTIQKAPDLRLRIAAINIDRMEDENAMVMLCYYSPNRISAEYRYIVTLPTDSRLPGAIDQLICQLREIHATGLQDMINSINLLYHKTAVLSKVNDSEIRL